MWNIENEGIVDMKYCGVILVIFCATTHMCAAKTHFLNFNGRVFAEAVDGMSYAGYTGAKEVKNVSGSFCVFDAPVVFKLSKFKQRVDLSETEFQRNADFMRAEFDKDVKFRRVKFHSESGFRFARFKSDAEFGETSFVGNANFIGAKFESTAGFVSANFGSAVSFEGTRFNSVALFDKVSFGSELSFNDAEFGTLADFRGASFGAVVDFNGALLPDRLNLSDVKFVAYELDFSSAKRNSGFCFVNLLGADISRVRLRYNIFRLWFPDSVSGSSGDWTGVKFEDKCNVYEQLLKNFETNGYTDSYEKLDIEYHQMRYAEKGQWYWDLIQKYWWNYGYCKWYIFLWIGGLMTLFTLLNIGLYPHLSSNVYRIRSLAKLEMPTGLRRIVVQPLYALTYTGFIFFGVKIDPDGIEKVDGWLYYIFFIYIVGLICLGYLANYIIAT